MTVIEDRHLDKYFAALTTVDTAAATGVVFELLDEGVGVAQIITDLLVPAQVRVGARWERGEWSVADEHAATAVTEAAVAALAAAVPGGRRGDPRHIAMACAEGEWHALPARMAATVAVSAGTRVTLLGPSLPAEHLQRRLEAGDVDLLALSCTLPTNLIGAARCVEAAHAAGVPVIVGGRAIADAPQRGKAVGADACAAEAADLLAPTPSVAGVRTEIPSEAVLLDAVDDASLALAYEQMVAAFPSLAQMTAYQQARTREDLRWMARHAGAAVLTGDPTIVDDLLDWLCQLLSGRVPRKIVTTSAQLVADAVEPLSTTGAHILRVAAQRADVAANAE